MVCLFLVFCKRWSFAIIHVVPNRQELPPHLEPSDLTLEDELRRETGTVDLKTAGANYHELVKVHPELADHVRRIGNRVMQRHRPELRSVPGDDSHIITTVEELRAIIAESAKTALGQAVEDLHLTE